MQRDWTNTLFIGASHLLAVGAILWLVLVEASPWTIGIGVLWYVLCGFAITGGYHRHFAHPTYRANVLVRAFYLAFGAAAVQNSAIRWSADHRRHHARTDKHEDPYNITRGFWWAHLGWVFYKDESKKTPRFVDDLLSDPLLVFQHRHYVALAILMSLVVPGLLGLLWGDPIGAILVACFLRLVVQWHATGAVNSVAHWMGSRPYSRAISARDSFVTAILTLGEGYHNFHHRFQLDYRNGVRWWQFDPTKWVVWTFERVGLAWEVRRTAPETIQRARELVREEVRSQR
jgi:stearoyl-CoA desaturase (delta-9 desaturase)